MVRSHRVGSLAAYFAKRFRFGQCVRARPSDDLRGCVCRSANRGGLGEPAESSVWIDYYSVRCGTRLECTVRQLAWVGGLAWWSGDRDGWNRYGVHRLLPTRHEHQYARECRAATVGHCGWGQHAQKVIGPRIVGRLTVVENFFEELKAKVGS